MQNITHIYCKSHLYFRSDPNTPSTDSPYCFACVENNIQVITPPSDPSTASSIMDISPSHSASHTREASRVTFDSYDYWARPATGAGRRRMWSPRSLNLSERSTSPVDVTLSKGRSTLWTPRKTRSPTKNNLPSLNQRVSVTR